MSYTKPDLKLSNGASLPVVGARHTDNLSLIVCRFRHLVCSPDYGRDLTAAGRRPPALSARASRPRSRCVARAALVLIVQAGYRHLDLAKCYGNQKEVGEGIKRGLKAAGIKREDVFSALAARLPWLTSQSRPRFDRDGRLLLTRAALELAAPPGGRRLGPR